MPSTPAVRLVMTRTSTHLLSHARQLPDDTIIGVTACGKTVRTPDAVLGTHESGSLAGGLCKSCRRTGAFVEALDQAFRYENRAVIAQAEAYVQTRFFPPLPVAYGVLAVHALQAANGGDAAAWIYLPVDLDPRPRKAYGDRIAAADLIDALKLWHLVDEDVEL